MIFRTLFSILTVPYKETLNTICKQDSKQNSPDWRACWVQGRRQYMEDRLSITEFTDSNGENVKLYFGYDGHGGDEISEISSKNFPDYLIGVVSL